MHKNEKSCAAVIWVVPITTAKLLILAAAATCNLSLQSAQQQSNKCDAIRLDYTSISQRTNPDTSGAIKHNKALATKQYIPSSHAHVCCWWYPTHRKPVFYIPWSSIEVRIYKMHKVRFSSTQRSVIIINRCQVLKHIPIYTITVSNRKVYLHSESK